MQESPATGLILIESPEAMDSSLPVEPIEELLNASHPRTSSMFSHDVSRSNDNPETDETRLDVTSPTGILSSVTAPG